MPTIANALADWGRRAIGRHGKGAGMPPLTAITIVRDKLSLAAWRDEFLVKSPRSMVSIACIFVA